MPAPFQSYCVSHLMLIKLCTRWYYYLHFVMRKQKYGEFSQGHKVMKARFGSTKCGSKASTLKTTPNKEVKQRLESKFVCLQRQDLPSHRGWLGLSRQGASPVLYFQSTACPGFSLPNVHIVLHINTPYSIRDLTKLYNPFPNGETLSFSFIK